MEYMDLKEDIEGNNQELIESYELENSLFKEAYEKLGRKMINSCKFNEETIRNKLHHISGSSTQTITELLLLKYKSGDVINIKEVKAELQKIYNSLNINCIAKGTEVANYLNVHFATSQCHRVIIPTSYN